MPHLPASCKHTTPSPSCAPPSVITPLPPCLRRALTRYPTKVSQASGGEAIVQKMEQTLAVLREDLEQEVQALSKSRSIEDRAALMAKEADVSKVRATENRRK